MANRDEIIQSILKGDVVAIPTETVYGLASLPSKEGRKKLACLKNNEKDKQYTLLFSTKSEVREIFEGNEIIIKLVNEFMPGPFTIIGESNGVMIGARVPDHYEAVDIIRQTGPLFVTSANMNGREPIETKEEIESTFDISVLDGENSDEKPSTIIMVKNNEVEIIRVGSISEKEIMEVIK